MPLPVGGTWLSLGRAPHLLPLEKEGNRQPLSLYFSFALHPLKMGLIFVHNQRLFGLLPGVDGG